MKLVLNEISVSKDPRDQYVVKNVFDTFLSTYSNLIKNYSYISRIMIISSDINALEISPGYLVAQWRNSKDIDRELRRRFLGLCEHLEIIAPIEDELLCETCHGEHGEGIQLAAEMDAPLISFSFLEEWKKSQVQCNIYRISNKVISEEYVHNFSTAQTIEENQGWLTTSFNDEICKLKTPPLLLEKREVFFPSLCFVSNALKQIKTELTQVTVPIVAEKLYQLEKYFSNWDGKEFKVEMFPARTISPESVETLRVYKKEHTYLYEGQEIIVSYHMRYTGGDIPGRIYFYPDHRTKKCVICSVTTKLPTVTDPKFRK